MVARVVGMRLGGYTRRTWEACGGYEPGYEHTLLHPGARVLRSAACRFFEGPL